MEFKGFAEAKAYLELLIPKDNKLTFGLERIRALLGLMGNPQSAYPTIHVGGTAGKGSTSMIIAGILQQAGYSVGLHVSPHLEDIREREQVNGKIMSKTDFLNLVNYIKPYLEQTAERYPYGMPTYFEAMLALAFEHFRKSGVDIAVIEVGLGGRLDGTNVITPKVAVLTNVGLDHTEILGNTVEKIANDKVGIFKEGIELVSGVMQPSVITIVENQAKKMNCRLDLLGRQISYTRLPSASGMTAFDLRLGSSAYKNLVMPILGGYQIANAALAIDAVLKLNRQGFRIGEKEIRATLQKMKLPGRFEIVNTKPVVILDGAHNPMKISALAKALEEYYPNKCINFVFAVKSDKNTAEMLRVLSKIANKFYFTKFEAVTDFGQNMSKNPDELLSLTTSKCEAFKDSAEAYKKAISEAEAADVICITGSLYLVGELRTMILNKK